MVTFILICIAVITVAVFAFGGILALGAVLSGVALIVADIAIGLAPFILAFMLIRWLFKERG